MAKKSSRYKNLISLVQLVAVIFFVYMLITTGYRVFNQRIVYQRLVERRTTLLEEKEQLSKEVELLNDDDYVVRYARDNYVFSKDGEEVVQLPDSKK